MAVRLFRFALIANLLTLIGIGLFLVQESPMLSGMAAYRPALMASTAFFFAASLASLYFGLWQFWDYTRYLNAALTVGAFGILTAANFAAPKFHVLSPTLWSFSLLAAFLSGMILTLSFSGTVAQAFAPGRRSVQRLTPEEFRQSPFTAHGHGAARMAHEEAPGRGDLIRHGQAQPPRRLDRAEGI